MILLLEASDQFAVGVHERLFGFDLRERIRQVEQAVPDGREQPLAPEHWQRIERLNACLREAEQLARAHQRHATEDQVQAFELICWLHEDDMAWREDADNIVYQNTNLLLPSMDQADTDWNTFRHWDHDPLGGRPCGYFLHDLIDHGLLQQRDLLRIGALSLHVNTCLMGEFTVAPAHTSQTIQSTAHEPTDNERNRLARGLLGRHEAAES